MNDGAVERIGRWRAAIDAELAQVAAGRDDLPDVLRDAIHYSLTGEGKRFRGLLLIASYDALGGTGDASALAAAIEVVHAYSLVHDDLPCMDDDSMRRGRPTTHLKYGVATATVAGVAMVPLAVEQTLRGASRLGLDDAATRRLVETLMRASGASGMVGGQLMDLDAEGRSLSVAGLEAIHQAKTGALIVAALTMGGIAAAAREHTVSELAAAGAQLGLAFQIADDVLDATATSESLGKTAGRDAVLEKSTYASVLGVATARQRSDALVADAMTRLDAAGLRTHTIDRLAHFVAARRS
ncbi:MAG TPA: polyprenyl synthetase family protein [Gemmatimonadaceae bacterium]|nr:polyprenyl synthetase family protein [Gemmatimonadaceae bacterium]